MDSRAIGECLIDACPSFFARSLLTENRAGSAARFVIKGGRSAFNRPSRGGNRLMVLSRANLPDTQP